MNCWQGKSVLVTGASGFVGKHLVQKLHELEADVSEFTSDVGDYDSVLRAIYEREVDTVFHLAAQTIVGRASRAPMLTFKSNIKGSWNVLEAARTAEIRKVVIASSDKAYGKSTDLPYKETHPLCGSHPYDVSKSCVDLLSQAYFKSYKLPVVILRCGNIYGPGDLNTTRIIPGTIKSVLKNEPPIIRSDGKPERDYLYVGDAVKAYLTCAEKGVDGEAYNFGNELPVSVLDLVAMILNISGSTLTPRILGGATDEIPNQYLDCNKAHVELEWAPDITIEQGIHNTIKWWRAKE